MSLPRSLWRIAALVPLVALTSLSVEAAAAPVPQQEPTVTIRLTGAGVQVAPDRITVQRGQSINWNSSMPFAIAVERNNALFGRTLPPQALRGRANAPVRAQVGGQAAQGTYKYAVAVWDGENVWVVDPEIVVPPPGE